MKKTVLFLLCISLLVGCSRASLNEDATSANQSDAQVLKVYKLHDMKGNIQSVFDEFKEETGVDAEYREFLEMNPTETAGVVNTEVLTGNGPDILHFNLELDFLSMFEKGYLKDLTNELPALEEKYLNHELQLVNQFGNYQIPVTSGMPVIRLNTKLMDELGIKLSDDVVMTMDELLMLENVANSHDDVYLTPKMYDGLYMMVALNQLDFFVDRINKTHSIDSSDFRTFIEEAKQIQKSAKENPIVGSGDKNKSMQLSRTLMYPSRITYYQELKGVDFFNNGEVSIKLLPRAEGSSISTTYISTYMLANKDNSANAILLVDKLVDKNTYEDALSTVKSVHAEKLESVRYDGNAALVDNFDDYREAFTSVVILDDIFSTYNNAVMDYYYDSITLDELVARLSSELNLILNE